MKFFCLLCLVGCADCKRRCNNEIREKLDILFPDMPKKRFDEVLAKETGAVSHFKYPSTSSLACPTPLIFLPSPLSRLLLFLPLSTPPLPPSLNSSSSSLSQLLLFLPLSTPPLPPSLDSSSSSLSRLLLFLPLSTPLPPSLNSSSSSLSRLLLFLPLSTPPLPPSLDSSSFSSSQPSSLNSFSSPTLSPPPSLCPLPISDETVADEYAALLVQAEWRSFMLRRRRIVDIFKGSERRLLVREVSVSTRLTLPRACGPQ